MSNVNPSETGGQAIWTLAERNTITAKLMLERINFGITDIIPHSFISGDGEWHEKGRMGMFGISSDNKSERDWFDKVVAALQAEPDGTICVGIDCHC